MLGLGLGIHRNNYVGGVNLAEKLANAFESRVLADGGTFEAKSCLITQLSDLGDLLNEASLVITPNATEAGELFSIIPTDGSGDLTVTRATSATRVNSAGLIESVGNNIARLDYTNGSCPSILVEPQSTNLATYSEDFTNWNINGTSTITSNDSISPSGELNADTFNSSGVIDVLNKLTNSTSGTVHTFSAFIKYVNIQWIRFAIWSASSGGNQIRVWVDLQNGVLGTQNSASNANTISSSIENYGNGWYRVSVTGNFTDSTTTYYPTITSALQDGSVIRVAGNYIIWGAQLEAGSNATSYIPTTSSTVTRNADFISKSGLTGSSVITEIFENNTTNVITNPTSYQMSQGRIKLVTRV